MVRKLPVVKHKGKLWFLDELLSQLRNVKNPHDWVDLNESEFFHSKKGCDRCSGIPLMLKNLSCIGVRERSSNLADAKGTEKCQVDFGAR